MAITEETIASRLYRGDMTLDEALTAFDGDDVYVWSAQVRTGDETWDQTEDMASTVSGVFAEMQKLGATPEQLDAVGANIDRLRQAGNTIEKLYAPSTGTKLAEGTKEG